MIYSFLLSNSRERLMKRKAEFCIHTAAKDIDEATNIAVEKMKEHSFRFCLILADEVPVKLIDLESEVFKSLARWFG